MSLPIVPKFAIKHSEYYTMLYLYNNLEDKFWDYPQDILDAFFDRLFALHDSKDQETNNV